MIRWLLHYLVTLLIRIAPVAVRKVDVAAGLCHHSSDGVPALADDVAVVGVGHVHLHGDPAVGGRVQHLRDHHLRPHHALLRSASDPDVRILLTLGSNFQPSN